jgi:hypothetical protein
MIQPLSSISITETSTLLQVGPPPCSASVLSLLWVLHLSFPLFIRTTGSHFPHKNLAQVHATFMPDAVQAVNRFLLDSSWSGVRLQFRHHPFVFDTSSVVRLRSSPWTLPDTVFAKPFSSALTTRALYPCSLRRFGVCSCKPTPKGLFPHLLCSLVAHVHPQVFNLRSI